MSLPELNPLHAALAGIFTDVPLVTLEQNVDRALQTMTAKLDCDGVFVLSASTRQPGVTPRNIYLKPGSVPNNQVRHWPLARMPYFRRLMRQPRLLNVPDIARLPSEAAEEKRFLREWRVKSLLVLTPVHFGETQIALGAVNCERAREWSQAFMDELGIAATLICAVMELTRIAQALTVSERRYQELFNQLPLACGLVDRRNRVKLLNSIARQNLPVSDGQDLLALVRPEEEAMLQDTLQVVRDGVLSQAWCEISMKGPLLNQQWIKLSFSTMSDDPGTLLMLAEDVSERHRLADELSFHANYDALTGLPNRSHFEAVLDKLLQQIPEEPICVAFLDLDQFQVINNVSGHQAGDKLLCQVALRLKQLVRKGDTVARLGGDEFAILMHYCNEDTAKVIAQRICTQLFEHEFYWEHRRHNVSVSMGVAPLDAGVNDIYVLMSRADAACRLAKEQGRNGWHIYCATDPKMNRLYSEMTASVDIIDALSQNQFQLYYQLIEPLLNEQAGIHMEILLRLQRPDGKMLSPGLFLPAAERYNLASRVDRWVIDNLLRWGGNHLALWQELDMVSVNLSANSLSDQEFMEWLEIRLMAEPELVSKLCFEITETAAVSQLEQAQALIELLRPLGCKLALDDFGSGFSSFAYLKLLDVDFVKIDGQFVVNLCDNKSDQAIVNAICQLGRDMDFDVIAEFVESEAVGLRLRELEVDYAQGYAIGKPEPLDNLSSGKRVPWLSDLTTG
ncbi:bifunctional diguanylate cyclase/phosphodiesterase [Shewanella amazonensis]|uniref:Diguanylate cyclase/phosphodiesterase n=1 Tax=Shewanella amazonensis (strain ATCC BAA-1098 / SB2B) TaxID=326297 RepID=A1S9W9_SHEAM|nr:EAL domain-containing protein [Shewanella amazonensis]ABM01176.1 diguanylate cyclase/phosphodiesterase [Shewanella amazonensis SB2B]